jgi:hypothetical protein
MTSAPCCSPWKARHNPPYSRSASSREDRPALKARLLSSEAVHPLTSAPSVGSSADAPGPPLRDPPPGPDAGAQADEGAEVIEAGAESDFLKARDGQVGLTVGDGLSQLFVYPARARSSGEFTQTVIHLTDVRAAVKELRGRGVAFEEYDTPETRTENGIARTPGGGEAAWFKD